MISQSNEIVIEKNIRYDVKHNPPEKTMDKNL